MVCVQLFLLAAVSHHRIVNLGSSESSPYGNFRFIEG